MISNSRVEEIVSKGVKKERRNYVYQGLEIINHILEV